MPVNKNKQKPPEVMTWRKASFVLIFCVIFDSLRFFFTLFWFFGPALVVVYCTSKVSAWVGQLWGLTAAACTAVGGVVGFFGAPITAVFGTIMAMAVGLFGWLTVGLIILMTNSRIIKENTLLFVGGLIVGEIPFVGALPALTGTTVKMYSAQIKQDREALKKYEKEQEEARIQEQNQQLAYFMQARVAQQEQEEQQEIQEVENKEEQEEDNAKLEA